MTGAQPRAEGGAFVRRSGMGAHAARDGYLAVNVYLPIGHEDMKLWVDADAAPRDIKEIVQRAAQRLGIEAIFVANQRVQLPPGNPNVSAIRVEGGPDVADQYIAERAGPGDVAVTADIPLASILVERGVITIDPRGDLYSSENIGERLAMRDFMEGMRGAGMETGGSRPFGPKDKQNFANALDRTLSRAKRRT